MINLIRRILGTPKPAPVPTVVETYHQFFTTPANARRR